MEGREEGEGEIDEGKEKRKEVEDVREEIEEEDGRVEDEGEEEEEEGVAREDVEDIDDEVSVSLILIVRKFLNLANSLIVFSLGG